VTSLNLKKNKNSMLVTGVVWFGLHFNPYTHAYQAGNHQPSPLDPCILLGFVRLPRCEREVAKRRAKLIGQLEDPLI